MWRISAVLVAWMRRRIAAAGGAEYERMPGAFRADLLRFLKQLILKLLGLRRLFHRKAGAEPILPEIASVRQIYRQFLRWAANAGFPRHLSQTPHEYLYEMVSRLPEAEEDMDLITQQYVRTRYGARLLTGDELHQLEQSWYNVKRWPLGDRR
jgi:hypothetical protein